MEYPSADRSRIIRLLLGSRERIEAVAAIAYAGGYIAYLFVHQESETLHWLTLVALPLAGVVTLHGLAPLRLTRAGIRRGWWWVVGFALPFQLLQLMNHAQAQRFFDTLHGSRGVLLVLITPLVLVATAATTEEVFFRGVLQRAVADAAQSEIVGAAVGVVAFVFYHLPYAYLSPGWPSAGNLGEALQAACASGLVGGIPLAIVYIMSRRNLLAVITLHAAFDFVPAVRLLDRLLPR